MSTVAQGIGPNSLFEPALDCLANAVFVKDAGSRVIYCNAAYCRLLGMTRAAVLGRNDLEMFPADRAEDYNRADAFVLSTGTRHAREDTLFPPGRAAVPVITTKCRIEDTDGQHFVLGVMTDISERRAQEAALSAALRAATEADRAKTRFLSMMSHEIRTPMNGIFGMVQVLRASGLAPEQERLVGVLAASAERLMGVLSAILDYADLASGVRAYRAAPFALDDLVGALAARHGAAARAVGLGFELGAGAATGARLLGDEGFLAAALDRVLENAIRYTPAGGVRLAVASVPRADGATAVTLVVEDTGPGMPAGEGIGQWSFGTGTGATAMVGDPGAGRPTRAETTAEPGPGLGLPTAERMLAQMGGRLDFGAREGGGTRVTVCLALPTA
ncbi:MAG: PAS domain-containing sensor histidine kinase [Paracoccaceae bacterium]